LLRFSHGPDKQVWLNEVRVSMRMNFEFREVFCERMTIK
jgi:hypothetical protein